MHEKSHNYLDTKIIRHPEWCDQQKCTATPATATGESHQGTPVTITAHGGIHPVTVTAHLTMAHAPWMTDVFVHIAWSGLISDAFIPVVGRATLPASALGELASMLGGLAARADADKQKEVAEYLAALSKEVE
jgi:hypothetical protein